MTPAGLQRTYKVHFVREHQLPVCTAWNTRAHDTSWPAENKKKRSTFCKRAATTSVRSMKQSYPVNNLSGNTSSETCTRLKCSAHEEQCQRNPVLCTYARPSHFSWALGICFWSFSSPEFRDQNPTHFPGFLACLQVNTKVSVPVTDLHSDLGCRGFHFQPPVSTDPWGPPPRTGQTGTASRWILLRTHH